MSKTIKDFFSIEELVHPDYLKKPGVTADTMWVRLRPEAITAMLRLRLDLDSPITVNNWHKGGSYKDSGLRIMTNPSSKSASVSMHYFAGAFDLKFSSPEMRSKALALIKKNFRRYGITAIENPSDTPTWIHIDFRVVRDTKTLHIINV